MEDYELRSKYQKKHDKVEVTTTTVKDYGAEIGGHHMEGGLKMDRTEVDHSGAPKLQKPTKEYGAFVEDTYKGASSSAPPADDEEEEEEEEGEREEEEV